jgi:hypothetical protein
VRTARLYRVKICETDSNHVEYMGEETPEWCLTLQMGWSRLISKLRL